MSKNKFGGDKGTQGTVVGDNTTEQPTEVTESSAVKHTNFVLTYRREHPGARCSYGIAGNPGIVVFDEGLFAGFGQAGFQPPATITLDCALVDVKIDNKQAKIEAQAAKLAEKAAAAQKKLEESQAKAEAKRVAAEAKLAAAQAKVAAAKAGATGAAATDVPPTE